MQTTQADFDALPDLILDAPDFLERLAAHASWMTSAPGSVTGEAVRNLAYYLATDPSAREAFNREVEEAKLAFRSNPN